MKIYHKFLLYQNKLLRPYVDVSLKIVEALTYVASLIFILTIVYRYGYDVTSEQLHTISLIYKSVWILFLIDFFLHVFLSYSDTKREYKKTTWVLSILLMLSLIPVIFKRPEESGGILQFWEFMSSKTYRSGLLLVFSLFNLSNGLIRLLGRKTNPALMLAGSFIVIIIIGSGLLMLPNCTVDGINWVDSVFVSTSAVCVTGLSPVDIATTFTPIGLTIIIILIQIGGLGVMTFTSFFAMFFMGNTSVYNQLVVRDMMSTNSLGSLFSTLMYILFFTLVIEGVGAFAIWSSIHDTLGMSLNEEIAFSVFHSISAFCNAGFSTLPGGMGDPLVFNQNSIFIYVSLLIVLGGIGFPILVNFKNALKIRFQRLVAFVRHQNPPHIYRLYSLNTKIVLYTSGILILGGTLLIGFLEWNGALAGMGFFEKITKALFMAVSPRSAGFSFIDPDTLRVQTFFIFLLFMWIGGAAQSTAGGVKVNTIAVVFLNVMAMLKRSDRIEVFGRKISSQSVRRAHATVFISLIVLVLSLFILTLLEPNISPSLLGYECVAAMSTCGAGLGITPLFGTPAKFLIVALMLVGRVGIITILLGFIKQKNKRNYNYPSGDIIIN